jgi:branched-subunit amino acid aminotransferase/4-amino-4-deoxychorismate lyase
MNIGVFTTLKISNGIPYFFNKHQQRLASHAEKLHIGQVKINEEDIQNYLRQNNLYDCALKIIVTTK